jgi:predicted nucleic-acid-binding protein
MRKSKVGSHYPDDWLAIANKAKEEAGWKCERCGHLNDYESGHVLTVHHLDMDCENNAFWNLVALCQKCHLIIQAKVVMERFWFLPHSAWFVPHVAGYYAHIMGLSENRNYVIENADYIIRKYKDKVLNWKQTDVSD